MLPKIRFRLVYNYANRLNKQGLAPTAMFYGMVVCFNTESANGIQIAIDCRNSSPRNLYIRTYWVDAWSAWLKASFSV